MIKVILRLDCGPDMDSADSYLVSEEDWNIYNNPWHTNTSDPLSDYAWQEAVEFAEGYGIYQDDEDEDGVDVLTDEVNGWFELYDPKEHDGLMTGTQIEWDWKEL